MKAIVDNKTFSVLKKYEGRLRNPDGLPDIGQISSPELKELNKCHRAQILSKSYEPYYPYFGRKKTVFKFRPEITEIEIYRGI